MRPKRFKFTLGGLLVAGAILYLVYSGFESGYTYYFTVDELQARASEVQDSDLRVAGTVAQGTLKRNPGTMEITFHLEGTKGQLPVYYKGVPPDLLQHGIQVVAEGRLTADGLFRAKTLLTACPSKYEEKLEGDAAAPLLTEDNKREP